MLQKFIGNSASLEEITHTKPCIPFRFPNAFWKNEITHSQFCCECACSLHGSILRNYIFLRCIKKEIFIHIDCDSRPPNKGHEG